MKRTVATPGLIILIFTLIFGSGCGFSELLSSPTATPYPTYTHFPTLTPYRTYTPYPTYTPMPSEVVYDSGEWVDGHFFSIKVVNVRTATTLDGQRPKEDRFVIVEVDWKTNDLDEAHRIEGIDFELVDDKGNQYAMVGMIYESDTFDTFGANAKFQEGKWRITRVSGSKNDTYIMVYDVPESATGLRLWYRSLPKIDLDL